MAGPTPKRTEDRRKRPTRKKANSGSLSSHSLRVAERRRTAFGLRSQGKTFQAIGEQLGMTPQRAHQLVEEELKARSYPQVDEHRRLVLERLEALLPSVFAKALAGDSAALNVALSIIAQERKLLGLDMPPGRFERAHGETCSAGSGDDRMALTFVAERNGRRMEAKSVAELDALLEADGNAQAA